jgi:hypothetical protein
LRTWRPAQVANYFLTLRFDVFDEGGQLFVHVRKFSDFSAGAPKQNFSQPIFGLPGTIEGVAD